MVPELWLLVLVIVALVLIATATIAAALYGWTQGRRYERAMKAIDAIQDERDEAGR